MKDEGDYVYEYFIGEHDMLPEFVNENALARAQQEDLSDLDSQDSNREDHDQNDYPDERSSYDGSDEDNQPIRKVYGEDEEAAAQKYNQKHQLKNRLFD